MVRLDGAGEIWSHCVKYIHIPSMKKTLTKIVTLKISRLLPLLVNEVHTGNVGLSLCVRESVSQSKINFLISKRPPT